MGSAGMPTSRSGQGVRRQRGCWGQRSMGECKGVALWLGNRALLRFPLRVWALIVQPAAYVRASQVAGA